MTTSTKATSAAPTSLFAAQVEKPKAKPATKPRATKAAKAKPATKAKTTAKPAATKSQLNYTLMPGARPSSGNALKAHTEAVFRLTGLYKGAVSKAVLSKAIGNTALAYHINQVGSLKQEGGDVSMTNGGRAMFTERLAKMDNTVVDAFIEALSEGKANDIVKNKDLIIKLA